MKQGFDSYATPVGPRERDTLTDEELVQSALMHSLDGEALELFTAITSPLDTQESFLRWVDEFNARPEEERGLNKYDHSRPLTENKDRTIERQTSKGYPYMITQQKNGVISLQALLA